MKKRSNFYKDELNIERVEEAIGYLAENLTLKEVLKVIREISYDMVAYWDEENCGVVYKDKRFNKHIQEQACKIQRGLSNMCDLFSQSIINAREFEDGYLEKWLDGGYLQNKICTLEEENKKLRDELEEM